MINNKKGLIFITVMIISILMIFIAVSSSNMLLQDAHMIRHLKYSMEAQYLAEAGINAALVVLSVDFSAKDNPANFPLTSIGGGTYDVTVIQNVGRVLLSSVGTFRGVSRTTVCEVKDNTATSLYYIMSSGSDFRLRALLLGWADINGDVHSNRNMLLHALWAAWIDIDTCGASHCDGSISACGTININEGWFGNVTYHGTMTEGAPAVTFPTFNYVYYQALAQASNDYYAGDVVWEDATLTPANGIIYVEGTARFRGTCHLYGGIVADKIIIMGELHQHKSGTRNVIVTRNDDMWVMYRLDTEEAVVCVGKDFRVFNVGSLVNITGTLIAKRYLRVWDALTYITYNHRLLKPDGLLTPDGENEPLKLISWNR